MASKTQAEMETSEKEDVEQKKVDKPAPTQINPVKMDQISTRHLLQDAELEQCDTMRIRESSDLMHPQMSSFIMRAPDRNFARPFEEILVKNPQDHQGIDNTSKSDDK